MCGPALLDLDSLFGAGGHIDRKPRVYCGRFASGAGAMCHVIEEYPRARRPRHAERKIPAILP
jgi:hypothetical protein